MNELLLAAYLATDYRVRLACGGWAGIRIGQILPAPLAAWVGHHDWGFITAWNPLSQPTAPARNRHAQRQLLHALRQERATQAIHAAIGVGENWHEPSLFVIGPAPDLLDRLAIRFHQLAYVHGHGHAMAQLRLLPP